MSSITNDSSTVYPVAVVGITSLLTTKKKWYPPYSVIERVYAKLANQKKKNSNVLQQDPVKVIQKIRKVRMQMGKCNWKSLRDYSTQLVKYLIQFGALIKTDEASQEFIIDDEQFSALKLAVNQGRFPDFTYDVQERLEELLAIVPVRITVKTSPPVAPKSVLEVVPAPDPVPASTSVPVVKKPTPAEVKAVPPRPQTSNESTGSSDQKETLEKAASLAQPLSNVKPVPEITEDPLTLLNLKEFVIEEFLEHLNDLADEHPTLNALIREFADLVYYGYRLSKDDMRSAILTISMQIDGYISQPVVTAENNSTEEETEINTGMISEKITADTLRLWLIATQDMVAGALEQIPEPADVTNTAPDLTAELVELQELFEKLTEQISALKDAQDQAESDKITVDEIIVELEQKAKWDETLTDFQTKQIQAAISMANRRRDELIKYIADRIAEKAIVQQNRQHIRPRIAAILNIQKVLPDITHTDIEIPESPEVDEHQLRDWAKNTVIETTDTKKKKTKEKKDSKPKVIFDGDFSQLTDIQRIIAVGYHLGGKRAIGTIISKLRIVGLLKSDEDRKAAFSAAKVLQDNGVLRYHGKRGENKLYALSPGVSVHYTSEYMSNDQQQAFEDAITKKTSR